MDFAFILGILLAFGSVGAMVSMEHASFASLLLPAPMILVFGASDLVAKGTSLLMMIPTSLSGTIGNIRRRNVDLAAGLSVGLAACATAPLGVLLATALDPRIANILFAVFLVAIAVQLAVRAVRGRRARRGAE